MAAEITLEVDPRLRALCCRYNSGGKTPDYDAGDAFIALCTALPVLIEKQNGAVGSVDRFTEGATAHGYTGKVRK
jgi:hypothetical protein